MPLTASSAAGPPRPLVFAHRGGCALGPENTIRAFDRGLAAGADGIELDVHLSRDGIVVVHHDETLDRTTDARGPLAACTADELARVDAACRFDPGGGDPLRGRGVGVPRLRVVLERYPGIPVIVELKGDSTTLAVRVVDDLRAAGALERAWLGSYSRRALRAARAYEPRLATGAAPEETRWALYRSWVGWPLGPTPYRALQVPETSGRTRIVSPRFVRAAHAAGLPVHVWVVDAEADIRRLLAWGVDGIITDRPDVAARVVRESRDQRR
jgi:glycerophosphoryl diester phosphodiesterase